MRKNCFKIFIILCTLNLSSCASNIKSNNINEGEQIGSYYLPKGLLKYSVTEKGTEVYSFINSDDKLSVFKSIIGSKNLGILIPLLQNKRFLGKVSFTNKLKSLKFLNDEEIDYLLSLSEEKNFTFYCCDSDITKDNKQKYFLNYYGSFTSDDKVELEKSDSGLIKKITFSADNKSSEIISKASEIVTNVFLPSTTSMSLNKETEILNGVFDPFIPEEIKKVNLELKNKFPDNNFSISFTDLNGETVKDNTEPASKLRNKFGIFYRPLDSYKLIVNQDNKSTLYIKKLPSNTEISGFTIDGNYFVKKEISLELDENGEPKKISMGKPSEGLSVVSIPVSVFKSLTSAISDIFQLKLNFGNKEEKKDEKEADKKTDDNNKSKDKDKENVDKNNTSAIYDKFKKDLEDLKSKALSKVPPIQRDDVAEEYDKKIKEYENLKPKE
jgi:hypothetical protein